jgi:hypothetical protein
MVTVKRCGGTNDGESSVKKVASPLFLSNRLVGKRRDVPMVALSEGEYR